MKISHYVDDATFFVEDFESLTALMQLLRSFATISGLHINYNKSHLLPLGHHLDPPTHARGIQVIEQLSILGITFRNNMSEDQQYDLNFKPKLMKIKEICSMWLNRNLSTRGKGVLITAFMSPILQYPCRS